MMPHDGLNWELEGWRRVEAFANFAHSCPRPEVWAYDIGGGQLRLVCRSCGAEKVAEKPGDFDSPPT